MYFPFFEPLDQRKRFVVRGRGFILFRGSLTVKHQSALDRACDAFDEAALEQQEDQCNGKSRNDKPDHLNAVIGIITRGNDLCDMKDDGLLRRRIENDHRPHIVVPRGHKRVDRRRGIGRAHTRKHDLKEDTQLTRTIDARRLQDLVWNGLEALPEEKQQEDRADRRQDDRPVAVGQTAIVLYSGTTSAENGTIIPIRTRP